MKTIINLTKTLATMAGLFAGFMVFVIALMMALDALGIDSYSNRRGVAQAKVSCAKRGGQWITNPNSWIPSKTFGQGCSIDYDARNKK